MQLPACLLQHRRLNWFWLCSFWEATFSGAQDFPLFCAQGWLLLGLQGPCVMPGLEPWSAVCRVSPSPPVLSLRLLTLHGAALIWSSWAGWLSPARLIVHFAYALCGVPLSSEEIFLSHSACPGSALSLPASAQIRPRFLTCILPHNCPVSFPPGPQYDLPALEFDPH